MTTTPKAPTKAELVKEILDYATARGLGGESADRASLERQYLAKSKAELLGRRADLVALRAAREGGE